MKLSTIALSTVITLGVISVGGSWYTGKQVEEHYQEWIQIANNKLEVLQQSGVQAELKNVSLERHLFSSDIHYDFETKIDGFVDKFSGSGKVYHGPLPINRLLKGNILPAMASLETTVFVPENLKAFFNSPELAFADVAVSYSGNISGNLNGKGMTLDKKLPFQLSDFSSHFDVNSLGKGNVAVKIPKVIFWNTSTNQEFSVEQIEYKMALTGESQYPQLSSGDIEMKVKSYTISNVGLKDAPQVIANNLSFQGDSQFKGAVYESKGDFSSELALKMPNNMPLLELGKLKMDILMAMDAKSLNEIMSFLGHPDKWQSPKMEEAIQSLLSKPIKYQMNNMVLENAKGKNQITLRVNSDGIDFNKIALDNALTPFKQSILETTFNIESLEELFKQINLANPKTVDKAEILAKEFISELAYQAKGSQLAVVDDKNIRLKLEVDEGNVKLNDREVPEQDVQNALIMMMFGLGSFQGY